MNLKEKREIDVYGKVRREKMENGRENTVIISI